MKEYQANEIVAVKKIIEEFFIYEEMINAFFYSLCSENSQSELAKKINLKQSEISMFLSGKRTISTHRQINSINSFFRNQYGITKGEKNDKAGTTKPTKKKG